MVTITPTQSASKQYSKTQNKKGGSFFSPPPPLVFFSVTLLDEVVDQDTSRDCIDQFFPRLRDFEDSDGWSFEHLFG